VLGTSAVVGGFAVAALTLGWPVAATLSGRIYLRVGFRKTALLGVTLAIGGSVVLVTVTPASGVLQLALGCTVIGAGLGFISAPALVAAQASPTGRTAAPSPARPLRPLGRLRRRHRRLRRDRQRGRHGGGQTPENLPGDVLAGAIHAVFVGTLAVAVSPRSPSRSCRRVPATEPEPEPEPSTVD
jgi:hypothetical protein